MLYIPPGSLIYTLKNGGWKTTFTLGPGNFSGAVPVKLRGGYIYIHMFLYRNFRGLNDVAAFCSMPFGEKIHQKKSAEIKKVPKPRGTSESNPGW